MFKVVILVLLFARFAWAGVDPAQPELQAIEKYLGEIETFEAKFVQKFGKQEDKGVLKLKMPGRVRVEYFSDVIPILITINKGVFMYYDKKLRQRTQLSTPKTIGSFFLEPRLSLFNPDVLLLDFKKTPDSWVVVMQKKGFKEEGTFLLYFEPKGEKAELKKLVIEGVQGIVEVALYSVKINGEVKNSEFFIPNNKVDSNLKI